LSRLADYLAECPDLDPQRLAVIGHSRLGKTALLAGAFDDRFRVVISNQSGVGGAGPSRHNDPKAETVQRITTAFPHWFAPAYAAQAADPNQLPFDQNSLVALCAPRAVLFTNASADLWANPRGQFEILQAADPVYKLLGEDGFGQSSYPSEKALVGNRLGYWFRAGKHAMTIEDWPAYWAFADRWLK
jgi:hypothetical protein